MTVTTSYPGVYIQELPSLVHSIRPAPTSIAVFVGYTHPLRTKQFGVAVQLFSFADYQANFGGFFASPWQPDYVGQAVFQFFLNGGPTCYVVGLPGRSSTTSDGAAIPAPGSPVARPSRRASMLPRARTEFITFTALQPVGSPGDGAGHRDGRDPDAGDDLEPAGEDGQLQRHGGHRRSPTAPRSRRTARSSSPISRPALQDSNLVTVTLSATPPTAYPATPLPVLTRLRLAQRAADHRRGGPSSTRLDFAAVFADYASLDKVPVFNLLATPGITDPAVTSEAVAYCERKRAFYIMDTPSPQTTGWDVNSIVGDFGQSTRIDAGASRQHQRCGLLPVAADNRPGHRADPSHASPAERIRGGIYGQEDSARGVWKSPAGIETALLGTTGVDPNGVMTDPQQGVLNQNAINCLRQFPGIGTVVFGARTTAGADANTAQQQWRYVAVRRMALFIEQTLYANLTWAVFEPNATPLWNALTQEVKAFMLGLFRQGAFAGTTPSQAFLVQCDSTTTTPAGRGERRRQRPGRLRPARAGGVRRHPDRSARRPGAELGGHHGQDFPGQPEPLRPVQGLPVSGLLRPEHHAGRRGEQGRRDQALVRRDRVQGGRQRHHPEGARADQVRADHARARA